MSDTPRHKPFLLLATRPEDAAADGEYEAILRFGELRPSELVRIRLEQESLPELDLSAFSGVIVGGGPFNVSDDDAAKTPEQVRVETDLNSVVAEVVAHDHPYLGLCYGVGVLGKPLGAVVDREHGEEAGPVKVSLTAAGEADPLLEGSPQEFYALVGHKEAISALPPNATLLATSAAAPVQLFKVGQNAYAAQYHPELDVAGMRRRIEIYRDFGYFKPDEYTEVWERAGSQPVAASHLVLRNFISRYRRNFDS